MTNITNHIANHGDIPSLPHCVSEDARQTMASAIESDDIPIPLDAAYQLRLWQAQRSHINHIKGCPPPPRVLTGLLSVQEQRHVASCQHCAAVLEKGSIAESLFERLEQRWLTFKHTRPILQVRCAQLVVVWGLCIVTFSLLNYPTLSELRETQTQLVETKAQLDGTYHVIDILGAGRNEQAQTVAELQSQLENEVRRRTALRREFAARYRSTHGKLMALQRKEDELKQQQAQIISTLARYNINVVNDNLIVVNVGAAPRDQDVNINATPASAKHGWEKNDTVDTQIRRYTHTESLMSSVKNSMTQKPRAQSTQVVAMRTTKQSK